ncbi:hypothetical protein LCM08_06370 [Salipiger pacificus]|nr:hypothetical protein [Alloyangia pacifica]
MVKVAAPEDPTIAAMWREREEAQRSNHRPQLDGAMLGRPCARQIFYAFRWVLDVQHDGRTLALQDQVEARKDAAAKDLTEVGVTVLDIDPDTGERLRVAMLGGHVGGALDGMVQGLLHAPKRWALLDFHLHGDKSFRDLKKRGVAEAKPEHFAKMQFLMRRSRFGLGQKLDRAYYLAENRNDGERWAEWVYYDADLAERLEEKAEYLVGTERPPARISVESDWFECRLCDWQGVCHGGALPQRNCRTCAHVTADPSDGTWRCALGANEPIPLAYQRTGCTAHRYHPHLIEGEPIAHDPDTGRVEYAMKTGATFVDEGPDGRG